MDDPLGDLETGVLMSWDDCAGFLAKDPAKSGTPVACHHPIACFFKLGRVPTTSKPSLPKMKPNQRLENHVFLNPISGSYKIPPKKKNGLVGDETRCLGPSNGGVSY